jgi:hypothetical protein
MHSKDDVNSASNLVIWKRLMYRRLKRKSNSVFLLVSELLNEKRTTKINLLLNVILAFAAIVSATYAGQANRKADQTNEIAIKANRIAEVANFKAEKANQLIEESNQIAQQQNLRDLKRSTANVTAKPLPIFEPIIEFMPEWCQLGDGKIRFRLNVGIDILFYNSGGVSASLISVTESKYSSQKMLTSIFEYPSYRSPIVRLPVAIDSKSGKSIYVNLTIDYWFDKPLETIYVPELGPLEEWVRFHFAEEENFDEGPITIYFSLPKEYFLDDAFSPRVFFITKPQLYPCEVGASPDSIRFP